MAFSRKWLICFALLAGFSGVLHAEKLVEITVQGQQSLSQKQILAVIRSREGEDIDPGVVNEDVKRIWRMGLFTNVKVLIEPVSGGARLIFVVQERSMVQEIRFFGNKNISDSSLTDKVTIKVGESLDPAKLAASIKAIEDDYKDKNYYSCDVTYDTQPASEAGKIVVNFHISEGISMKIRKIIISGNKSFSASELKAQMKDTEEAGWLYGGSYDPEKVAADLENVLKFYVSAGYAKAKLEGYDLNEFDDHSKEVVRKVTEFDDAAQEIAIRFDIDEGKKYTLTGVTLKGMQIIPESELKKSITSLDYPTFSMQRFDDDVVAVRKDYADKGYIYAGITPNYTWNDAKGQVAAEIDISEGNKAYIEAIKIKGNEVTKDKVIRRVLTIKPGDPFNSDAINQSRMDVYNLGFFENVAVDTEPGSEMDKLILIFNVGPEKKTGTLSVGAGYSSVQGLVGFLQVSQNNLFGNGQAVSAQWDFGNETNTYSLSFTEPWLMNVPLDLTTEIYSIERDSLYDSQGFNQDSHGGDIRLGYALNDFYKVSGTYRYQNDNISDVNANLVDITPGIVNTSSITPAISRDTRDNRFDPTRGTLNTVSIMLAGGYLGADSSFYEPIADTRMFFQTPVIFGQKWMSMFVLSLHGRIGWATPFDPGPAVAEETTVPVADRFFVGGTDSVRGYNDRVLGASETGGGNYELLTNIEYGFKPIQPLKLHVFYDAGNTWSDVSSAGTAPYLYPAAGVGMLFTIPTSVIQLRLDWGYALNAVERNNEGLNDGRVMFNIGNIF